MSNQRWGVFKNYYMDFEDGFGPLTDMFPVIYGTENEANATMAHLQAGSDKSWFDPDGNEYAGFDATLYVDRVYL